jgi:hypothetical protein
MKKLTYVTPEVKYAIVEDDILTESFNAGGDAGDDGVEVPVEPKN